VTETSVHPVGLCDCVVDFWSTSSALSRQAAWENEKTATCSVNML